MKTGIKVGDVMTRNVVSVSPDTRVYECLRVMSKKNVGSLVVMKGKKVYGILTQHDLLIYLAKNKKVIDKKVKQIMKRRLIKVSPSKDIGDAIQIMRKKNIHKLPVFVKGTMIGIITKRDILKIKPDLFDIINQKMQVVEEKEKFKRIEATGKDRWVKEGPCQECGAEDILYKVNERYLCGLCKKTARASKPGKPKRRGILGFLRR